MSSVPGSVGRLASRQSRSCLRYSSWRGPPLLADLPMTSRRCFQSSNRRLAPESRAQEEGQDVQRMVDADFWKEYRASFSIHPNKLIGSPYAIAHQFGKEATIAGFLTRITSISESLCFATVQYSYGWHEIQVVCRGSALCDQLRSIRLHSSIRAKGEFGLKRPPKSTGQDQKADSVQKIPLTGVELIATEILCLNSAADDVHISKDHNYTAQSRHLQIRFDKALRDRLHTRAKTVSLIRQYLNLRKWTEVETPILFKSSPEGAREFLVPTRKAGYAYALPQSPQQYKQILIASGYKRYYQFAKCFRDEDLRADRQPEFTQLDLEMAYATGNDVMGVIENLIKAIYQYFSFSKVAAIPLDPLPESPFLRMPYQEALSKHGSDKPDLRITGLIHRVDHVVSQELRSMLTSLPDPIIEICKLRLDCEPERVQKFVRTFMDSPDAAPFISNADGAPGFGVYDSRKPIEGLQIFGFEGAEKLKALYSELPQPAYQDAETHEINSALEDGDLLILQARQNLPHSGGSTILGKLRLAIHKAAVTEGLIKADNSHRYLWVTEFPMFTLDNDTDPGQGGTAGFSATHHPFTAPLTPEDVDLLLTDPLKAKADHYDLVVNGIELGGGSRRIHNAEMQKFVMRDIIKMSEERMNDFSHLFAALSSGCPPHAGFAIGFDRLIAVMTGVDSVRDVIVFPKSSKGEDMMVKSPAPITDEELRRYHLQLKPPVKVEGEAKEESPSEKVVEDMKSEPPSQA